MIELTSAVGCNFCGNDAVELKRILNKETGEYFYKVQCQKCGLETDPYKTRLRAVVAWQDKEFSNWTETVNENRT